VKDFPTRVALDVDALVARAKRPERLAAAEPRVIIRKTTTRPVQVTRR